MKHELKILSLHDAQAGCTCGKWEFVFTGSMTRDRIRIEWRKHKKGGISHDIHKKG